MNKLITSNTNYLLKPGHDQLFQEAREWKSDLEFYRTELSFLGKLLDKTFLRITTHAEIVELEDLNKKVTGLLDKKLEPLFKKTVAHEEYLGTMEGEKFHKSEDAVWEEQGKVRNEIMMFVTDAKKLKSDIFKSVEKIMRIANNASADFMSGSVSL